MKHISVKLSLILLISGLVIGFTSANNQKKHVQNKKSESYFKITNIIDHGFRLLEEKHEKLSPWYILEFEVLNNSNLTITKTEFKGFIFLPNLQSCVYYGTDLVPDSMSIKYCGIFFRDYPYHEDNWKPNTKRTIKIIMYSSILEYGDYADFTHTPEFATVEIKFTGGNIDKDFSSYLIDKFNVIEDWREYQRVIGLRK